MPQSYADHGFMLHRRSSGYGSPVPGPGFSSRPGDHRDSGPGRTAVFFVLSVRCVDVEPRSACASDRLDSAPQVTGGAKDAGLIGRATVRGRLLEIRNNGRALTCFEESSDQVAIALTTGWRSIVSRICRATTFVGSISSARSRYRRPAGQSAL
jgi:hypothetical protein